jgi:long-chain acyl-CoA synthetase
VLQYTGGTTGIAKGATLLHHTIVANLLASEAWMQPGLKRKPVSGQLTIVCALPLYHVFAFITCGLLGMRTGAVNLLIPNPRDIPGMVKELARYRLNIFPAVNTLFNALANNAEFAKLDFSGLLISNGGGMAVQEAVRRSGSPSPAARSSRAMASARTSAGVTCNPDRFRGLHRHDRPAAAQRLDQDPRRRRQRGAARPGRRDRDQGPAGDERLLAAPDETARS